MLCYQASKSRKNEIVQGRDCMKISYISCWCYLRVYAIQVFHLKEHVEKLLGKKVDLITSNCGCFYGGIGSVFASLIKSHDDLLMSSDVQEFIRIPHFRDRKEGGLLRRTVKGIYRRVAEPLRGFLFSSYSKGSDIVHFHQGPDAFGFEALKWFLHSSRGRKKVVTIHTLSAVQKEQTVLNSLYNECDAVITHTDHDRKKLIEWGVENEKIHVVPYGATLKPLKGLARDGAIMFAGSPLIGIKGFEHLAPALRKLKAEGLVVPLKLHGYHMAGHKEWADAISVREGISDQVRWLSFNSEDELIDAYQSSKICLIPYTEYPGSFPVTIAIANATPVVVSDLVGVAEYIKEGGGVVTSTSPSDIARAIRSMLADEATLKQHAETARDVAEKRYSWEQVSKETVEVYKTII